MFPGRSPGENTAKLADLFLEIPAAFACLHIRFRFPDGYGETFAAAGIGHQVGSLKSLLSLGGRNHRVLVDIDGLRGLARLNLNSYCSDVHDCVQGGYYHMVGAGIAKENPAVSRRFRDGYRSDVLTPAGFPCHHILDG